MSSVIRGNVRMALANFKRARARSVFTMFGVIIAVLPVLLILGIGEGITRQVTSQITQLGSDLITLEAGSTADASPGQTLLDATSVRTVSAFSDADLTALESLPEMGAFSRVATMGGTVTVAGQDSSGVLLIGANADLPTLLAHDVRHGAFFEAQDDSKKYAVLGRDAAEVLFGESAPLGQTFSWRGETFMVRGVFEPIEVSPLSAIPDFSSAIIIPYGTMQQLTGGAPVSLAFAKPSKGISVAAACTALEQSLTKTRGTSDDFAVLTQGDVLRITGEVLDLLTLLVAMVAGIALLVAGIGIMNIMLVSVAERTHEIGIRKAIGATKQQIMDQFMTEAALLTGIGALIGILLAFVGQYFIGLFTPVQPFITWQAVLAVSGVALFVGLAFGTVPAAKAARKDPIEALRQQ